MSTNREFPKIYFEFEGRKVFNGQKRKYWIQDATEDMLQEDEDLVVNYFFASSPTMKYLSRNYSLYIIPASKDCFNLLSIYRGS